MYISTVISSSVHYMHLIHVQKKTGMAADRVYVSLNAQRAYNSLEPGNSTERAGTAWHKEAYASFGSNIAAFTLGKQVISDRNLHS